MISEVAGRLEVEVEANLVGQANSVVHYYHLDLAATVAWPLLRLADFATDFGNWLPKPSVALTTKVSKRNCKMCWNLADFRNYLIE